MTTVALLEQAGRDRLDQFPGLGFVPRDVHHQHGRHLPRLGLDRRHGDFTPRNPLEILEGQAELREPLLAVLVDLSPHMLDERRHGGIGEKLAVG